MHVSEYRAAVSAGSLGILGLDEEVLRLTKLFDQVSNTVVSCFGHRLAHALARCTALPPMVQIARRGVLVQSCDVNKLPTQTAAELGQLRKLAQSAFRPLQSALGEQEARLMEDLGNMIMLRTPGKLCSIGLCPGNGACRTEPWAASAWARHFSVHTSHNSSKLRAEADEAAHELRLALLVYVMRRLVDQNLRAIKERLWQPEGRLMQRRVASSGAEGSESAELLSGCVCNNDVCS